MPKTSVKYQDSNTLKGLCQQRRLLTDDNERAALTRKILALRHVERTAWLHELHERSRRGDTTAIRYLKQRYKPNMGEAHDFVRSSGDIHAATTAMREHYQQLFGPDLLECQRRRVELVEHEFSSRAAQTPSPDFTEEEIQMAVDRLKHDKTTGLSGVSNEMLIQLWDLPEGAPLLHHHLNCLLRTNELPKGFCDAQVALIPKLESILKPGDYRPINLLESIHKLFAWLLITRLTPHWQLPTVQLGAIKGTQICDALLAAQARVTRDSKMQQYCIYLSCDVRAAFDSLSPGAVAAFLLEESDADRGHECLQMLRLLTRARLHFNWKGESWTIDQTSGVQQGGSHSAILFAYILGLAVQRLENRWRAQGHEPRHSSFSLLFVDDILLSFATWQEAIELTLQLQELLATMGLVLNEDKTKFMSHASVLEAGRRLQLPQSSLLNRIDWGTTCMYLRKTLTHFEVGAQTSGVGFADTSMVLLEAAGKATHGAYESLHRCLQRGSWYCIDDTIKLCNRYVGGTWFWYSPLIEPLAKYIEKIRSWHTTFLVLLLGLILPSDLSAEVAHWLHRLRRRLALVVMNHHVDSQWTTIWVKRRWNYLGRMLRKPDTSVAKRDMLALRDVRQSSPGPFNHLVHWGQKLEATDASCLQELAQNRDAWVLKFSNHASHYIHSHTIVHADLAPNWRDIFRVAVPWRLGVLLHFGAEATILFSWLDEVEGMQTYSNQGTFLHACKTWLGWLQLVFRGILLDVYMDADTLQAYTPELEQFHEYSYPSFKMVCTFTELSPARFAKPRSLT